MKKHETGLTNNTIFSFKFFLYSDASPSSGNNPTSAATITKRSSSNKPVNPTDSKQVNLVESESAAKRCKDNLPNREDYENLKTGRSPYYCISCEKSFTRSSIR